MVRACQMVRVPHGAARYMEAHMKPKSNSVVTVQQDGARLTFDVRGAGVFVFDTAKVHADNMAKAAMHGWKQRLSDAAALSRNADNGQPASPAEKLAAIQSLGNWYMEGGAEWARVGGGGGGLSITIEAIAAIKGVEYDAAEGYVADFAKRKFEGDTKKALAFLREGKRVAEKIAELRAARAPAPKVDADNALDELTK